ncbi:MAG: phage tail tape measure C-terminal domain-containing protein [Geminicoccaceae bacterium]
MARRNQTYAIRLAVGGGGQVKAELVSVGQSGEKSLQRIETAGDRASGGLKGIGRQAEFLRTGMRTLGVAIAGVATVGGLAALTDRSISAADAIGKTADKIGVGVEALQELRFAAKASGVEQQTLDMALQRFTRRAAEAANGTGEAKDALAAMGIALRDQSGNLRRSEDLLGDVANAFAKIEDPAERVRLAFKLFDSEGVALVNLLRDGSDGLDEMRERARDLGIVLDESLVRDAERARTELDTLSQVISANLTRATLNAAPVIADLSSWLADLSGKAGIAWERLFDEPEDKSLRTLRYELDLTSSTIEKLQGRIQELQESPTLGFTTVIDTAQIGALQDRIDQLSRARDQVQARIAFLDGPPRTSVPAPSAVDTGDVSNRTKKLEQIARRLESTLFNVTHQGSEKIIAEHVRRVAEVETLRSKDGSNAEEIDRLISQSASVREAQLSQLRAKEAAAAEKVRAANERVVVGLEAEHEALSQTERQRFVAQAASRLSAEATAEQRREVEELANALFDEQQASEATQKLLEEGRAVTDRTRSATELYAAEIDKLNQLLQAGAIDQDTYARAVEEANDRQLRSSQAWTDGATRFLQDYVAESQDAAAATERALSGAFAGAEDALVSFATKGKLEFSSLADSIVTDISRMAVRQTITAPIAGLLQGALAGGEFGLFHDGGVVGGVPTATRYADPAIFDQAPRYHTGGFAGGGLLSDEVPIIARRGELVVPPERIVRQSQAVGDQRPVTVMINVTAADANSFRASQAQIAAEAARAIERAGRNR